MSKAKVEQRAWARRVLMRGGDKLGWRQTLHYIDLELVDLSLCQPRHEGSTQSRASTMMDGTNVIERISDAEAVSSPAFVMSVEASDYGTDSEVRCRLRCTPRVSLDVNLPPAS